VTVKELVDKLLKLDQDAKVVVSHYDMYWKQRVHVLAHDARPGTPYDVRPGKEKNTVWIG
jgi:hypothetical protein